MAEASPPAKKAPAKTATASEPAAKKAAPSAAKRAAAKKQGPRLSSAKDLARLAPGSKYFSKARARASKIINDPDALKRVADEADKKAIKGGPLSSIMEDLRALMRLVSAYAKGSYREISPEALVYVVGGLLYVVMPADLIPDPIPVVGQLDDLAVIGWVIKSVHGELEAFRAWELSRDEPED